MKIIVVDDEMAALSTFLENVVDHPDIHCQMFRDSPLDAIKWSSEQKPVAAFLDMYMPTMDGLTLAKKLIEVVPSIRIFFITAYNFDESIPNVLGENFGGYCYKPYDKSLIINQIESIKKSRPQAFIKTFDAFELIIDNNVFDFNGAKTKELFAFAVNKNGAYVQIEEVIKALWPNKSSDLGQISYRDSVWKLKRDLNSVGLDSLLTFKRGFIKANKDVAKCDFWDLLDNKSDVTSIVSYMPNYAWAADYEAIVMDLLEKNMQRLEQKI
ncbi:MAG: response regulator [Bacilli bacterium]|nr:response regulator [Bacilli bacterium]